MIQSAQVASKFTLFTHHAKTFPDLVTALRNSMLRTGVFKDEKTAEEQACSSAVFSSLNTPVLSIEFLNAVTRSGKVLAW